MIWLSTSKAQVSHDLADISTCAISRSRGHLSSFSSSLAFLKRGNFDVIAESERDRIYHEVNNFRVRVDASRIASNVPLRAPVLPLLLHYADIHSHFTVHSQQATVTVEATLWCRSGSDRPTMHPLYRGYYLPHSKFRPSRFNNDNCKRRKKGA